MKSIARWFDFFAAPLFKTDRGGRSVFFPWGFWGSGYVLTSPEVAERVRCTVRATWAVFFLVGLPVFSLFARSAVAGDYLGFVILVGAGVGMSLWFRWLARDMARSDLRLSMREAQDLQIQAMGRGGLRAMLLLSVGLLALGLAVLAAGGRDGVLIGGALVVVFGACLGGFMWQWRRLKQLGG